MLWSGIGDAARKVDEVLKELGIGLGGHGLFGVWVGDRGKRDGGGFAVEKMFGFEGIGTEFVERERSLVESRGDLMKGKGDGFIRRCGNGSVGL